MALVALRVPRLRLDARLGSLILASASPRRAELLAAAGVVFRVVPADVDESAVPGETPRAQALRLARAKAQASVAADSRAGDAGTAGGTVLGADTLIELDGRPLGKPEDQAAARAMLVALAGREHLVHTAVALRHLASGRHAADVATSTVAFAPLGEGWLEDYLRDGEWRGKAGAYAIQGAGASFIRLRSGTLDTVIGLPCALVQRLADRLVEELP